jgi:hypothetical protein
MKFNYILRINFANYFELISNDLKIKENVMNMPNDERVITRKRDAVKYIAKGTTKIAVGSGIIVGTAAGFAVAGGAIGTAFLPVAGTATIAGVGATVGLAIATPIGKPFIQSGVKDVKCGVKYLLHHNKSTFFNAHDNRQDNNSYVSMDMETSTYGLQKVKL